MNIRAILLVGMSLATAWAVRGQFGHEHGAAWAGSIGSICILLLANRKDWTAKAFQIILAGALGWGIGGVMSYGLVVGYGRSTDFVNVYYGLVSLFVIGGLYGFMGGGLFGLAIGHSSKTPVKWSKLIVEMVVGALIFYFFIIQQFEFLMTPPRDESWAGVFGMVAALIWFMFRTKNVQALRVALFAGLGGGFGFAFGNFLQVLGTVSAIKFNFWNVMEYSLGFFGGIGMAYGTFTSKWEESSNDKAPNQWPAILMLTLIIPVIMWQQNFRMERLTETVNKLNFIDAEAIILSIRWDSLFLILGASIFWMYTYSKSNKIEYPTLKRFFIAHFGLYILLSLLITSAILSTYRIEQYLYIVNFGIILYLQKNTKVEFLTRDLSWNKYAKNLILLFLIIAVLAFIASHSHGELKGAHNRF
ncbi:photosystem II biosynthesis protein [Aquirufa sp. ROCK2-A2]